MVVEQKPIAMITIWNGSRKLEVQEFGNAYGVPRSWRPNTSPDVRIVYTRSCHVVLVIVQTSFKSKKCPNL